METIPRVQHDTDLLRTITKPIDDIDKLIRCLAPKCNQMLISVFWSLDFFFRQVSLFYYQKKDHTTKLNDDTHI